MERLQSVMIQFYLEKIYGLLFCWQRKHDKVSSPWRIIQVYDGALRSIPAFLYFVSVCNSKVKSTFFLFLHHLSVINSMQMKFVDLESENICFPKSLTLRLLGNLAMFGTWWRNSCKLLLFPVLSETTECEVDIHR